MLSAWLDAALSMLAEVLGKDPGSVDHLLTKFGVAMADGSFYEGFDRG